MYLEKLKNFEKEIKGLYNVENKKMNNFKSLTEFVFEIINLKNKYNIKVIKSRLGFRFRLDEEYLLFEEENNKVKKEYKTYNNVYNTIEEIQELIEKKKYMAEIFDLMDIELIRKIKEYDKFLSKEKRIVEDKINEKYLKIKQEKYKYIKTIIKKMFSGNNDVKEKLELIEKGEEDIYCVSFNLNGENIYFVENHFNIIKKGNKKHYISNGKRSTKSYIEKCLGSELYYKNKKISDCNEFIKLSFFKNLKHVSKGSKAGFCYNSDVESLFDSMHSYIKSLECKDKIEHF